MRNLVWGNTFIKALTRTLKKHPGIKNDIEETLKLLAEDPFDKRLSTHKLKGKLSGAWACSASYDLRIIFDFVKSPEAHEDEILLIEIGTHDEVY